MEAAVSSHRKTPEPSTLQLVTNHLAVRMVPAAVIHAWLAARRSGAPTAVAEHPRSS
jgi:hypothetical protein